MSGYKQKYINTKYLYNVLCGGGGKRPIVPGATLPPTKKQKKYIIDDQMIIFNKMIHLFTTCHLYEKVENIQPITVSETKQTDYQTPIKKVPVRQSDRKPVPRISDNIIYNYKTSVLFTPGSAEKITDLLKSDDEKIETLYKLAEAEDLDYLAYNANYGKTVETWIADNFKCPSCERKSLRRYVSDTMPVIDLMCTDAKHAPTHIRYWQVKASNGSPFMGESYFDIKARIPYTHVGSARCGGPIHAILPNDTKNKIYQIGYIFVLVDTELKIDMIQITNIWTVIPNLTSMSSDPYYTYLQDNRQDNKQDNKQDSKQDSKQNGKQLVKKPRNKITWDARLCIVKNMSEYKRKWFSASYLEENQYMVIDVMNQLIT